MVFRQPANRASRFSALSSPAVQECGEGKNPHRSERANAEQHSDIDDKGIIERVARGERISEQGEDDLLVHRFSAVSGYAANGATQAPARAVG
jgi:hypothetical protein